MDTQNIVAKDQNGNIVELETADLHKTIATCIRELRSRTVGKMRVTCSCGWEGTRNDLVRGEGRHMMLCPHCGDAIINASSAVTYVEYNGGNRQRRNRAGKRHQGGNHENRRSDRE